MVVVEGFPFVEVPCYLRKSTKTDAPQRLLASRKHVVSGNFAENQAFYGKGICDCSLEVPQTALPKGPQGRLKVRFLGSLAYFFSGVWRGIFLDFYQGNINWGEMYLCRLLVVQNHGFEKEKRGATLDHFQKRIEVTIKKTSKTNTCVSILG